MWNTLKKSLINGLQNTVYKNIIIFVIFGISYVSLELLYRGHSHITMFFVGGLCGLLIGLINEYTPKMPVILQMIIGATIVTLLELVTGYILNIKLGLNIWDYSNLMFNYKGQISLIFSILWFLLSYIVIKLDDYIRNEIL